MASKLTPEEIIDRIRRVTINVVADADPLIASPGAGLFIAVDALWVANNAATAQTLQFKSGTVAGGSIPAGAGPIGFQSGGGQVLDFQGFPLFVCVANEPLALDLSAATAVGGSVYYHVESV